MNTITYTEEEYQNWGERKCYQCGGINPGFALQTSGEYPCKCFDPPAGASRDARAIETNKPGRLLSRSYLLICLILLSSCAGPYVRTKSGINTREQKKRIRKETRHRPEYHTEYFHGIGVPVTNVHITSSVVCGAQTTKPTNP